MFNPKDNSKQVLQILEALKQASHHLKENPNNPNETNGAVKSLLELEHESEFSKSILSNDPKLATLSTHLTALKTVIQRYNGRVNSFLTRRVSSHEVSRLAGLIESEIHAWIGREIIVLLTQTLRKADETKDELLIDLIQQFEERIAGGFDPELQDSILRSKVFTELETILCKSSFSNHVRETCGFAITELIKFNKDVFVGQVLIGETVRALISLSSVRSIQILCILIASIKSPIVDEIESNGEIVNIVNLLTSDDISIRAMAVDCVLEIGYFGRKEAIDAMLEQDLVKKLVELQRGERFASCVARFAVQVEVGEGLRRREKRALKQEVLRRVREACVCEGEAATIVAEVLWGASA